MRTANGGPKAPQDKRGAILRQERDVMYDATSQRAAYLRLAAWADGRGFKLLAMVYRDRARAS